MGCGVLFYLWGRWQCITIIISSHAAIVYSLVSRRSNTGFIPKDTNVSALTAALNVCRFPVLNPLCREFLFSEKSSDPVMQLMHSLLII